MKLPPMEFSFSINLKGSKSNQVYAGDFTYRRLTIGDQGKADVYKTVLNGDLKNVSPVVDNLHDMISWLKFGLISYPSWWRESNFGLSLYDSNIVDDIFKQVEEFENRWNQKVKDYAESVTEDSNSSN